MDTYCFTSALLVVCGVVAGCHTLVFLLFVQGGNSLLLLPKTEAQRKMMVNQPDENGVFLPLPRWSHLVVVSSASFPLFYSTSFGGAYWLWMIILFVLQAVSYEFQSRQFVGTENLSDVSGYQWCTRSVLIGWGSGYFLTGSNQ